MLRARPARPRRYTLILANPPFAGSLDYETTAKDLPAVVKTKKTELLFLALFLRLLKPGGRAAVIVPDGVLFGSSKAHKELRRILVEDHKLDGVVKLPSWRVQAVRRGLDRDPVLHQDQQWRHRQRLVLRGHRRRLEPRRQADAAAARGQARTRCRRIDSHEAEHAKNNLPDVLARWARRDGSERERGRTEQSFCVPKADIAAQGYDLSLNRYKEIVHDEVEHRPPLEILEDLERIESEIQQGMSELKGDARMTRVEQRSLSRTLLLTFDPAFASGEEDAGDASFQVLAMNNITEVGCLIHSSGGRMPRDDKDDCRRHFYSSR